MKTPITKTFPRSELQALVRGGETKNLLEVDCRHIGGSGDTAYYYMVFREKSEILPTWKVEYDVSMDHNAFDYHPGQVPCTLVKAEQVLRTEYVTLYDEN